MSDQPRFGRIPDAVRRGPVKRAKLYKLAAKHRGLFRKYDDTTIVDFEYLDKILAELPPAELGLRRLNDSEDAA